MEVSGVDVLFFCTADGSSCRVVTEDPPPRAHKGCVRVVCGCEEGALFSGADGGAQALLFAGSFTSSFRLACGKSPRKVAQYIFKAFCLFFGNFIHQYNVFVL